MEEKGRFFKLLYKANLIIIFFVGITGLLVLSFAAYTIYKDKVAKKYISSTVNIENKTQITEKFKLEQNTRLVNKKYMITPLSSVQNYDYSYYSKSTSSIRNILFTNTENLESKWLFNTNKNLILDEYFISKERFNTDLEEAKAIIFKVANKDSNSDKRLGYKDNFSIYISSIDGKRKMKLLDNISSFSNWQFSGDENIIIQYKKGTSFYNTIVNLENFQIVKTKLINFN